jgi:hypothetical protein
VWTQHFLAVPELTGHVTFFHDGALYSLYGEQESSKDARVFIVPLEPVKSLLELCAEVVTKDEGLCTLVEEESLKSKLLRFSKMVELS